MQDQARVVVIGGGVVGCSVLYHLTKLGWSDVMLLERKQLTAGSTWHAAAGFHALNSDPNVARLQAYTINLYQEIEAASGQDVGLHLTGGLSLAATATRWEFLKAEHARHKVIGLESELVTPKEIERLNPLIDAGDLLGGLYDRYEGHLDPYGATHAYARAARQAGAQLRLQTRVEALVPRRGGGFDVVTDQGTIIAEHVVNAAGLWAREVGAMAGLSLPLLPFEHHYLITEAIPAVEAHHGELIMVVDLDGEMYFRQEGKGVLLGVYERPATPWAPGGTPWDYGEQDLLPPALDRLEDALLKGFQRFPAVAEAGIRRIVNGPFTFTPDGNPLVGPVRGVPNYWCACGVMAGFSQGGGVGLTLAQWLIDGAPEGDVFAMDVGRFGDFATPAYTRATASEFYERRFRIAFPNEDWPAGRPLKVSPAHDRLAAAGARFGESYGLEVPLFFADDPAFEETLTFRRSNAHDLVGAECRAVRASAGLLDATSFAKYEVTGPGAAAFLDRLLACHLPPVGRVRLAPMLAPSGRLMGDLTVMRPAADRFLLMGSGYLQTWHMRWFEAHAPAAGVTITNCSEQLCGFALAGPRAREILAAVAGEVADLPFTSVRATDAGFAPALVARLSVTGELGFEIYVPAAYLCHLHERLLAAGAAHGLRQIGLRALNSLRLEKSIGIWSREYSPDYTPAMAGLQRFVGYDKADFIGREAALAARDQPPPRRLVTLAIETEDADAQGYEPIFAGDRVVGFTTSGGCGHSVGLSLAMGYLDQGADDAPLEVAILGERRSARLLVTSALDALGRNARTGS